MNIAADEVVCFLKHINTDATKRLINTICVLKLNNNLYLICYLERESWLICTIEKIIINLQ